MTMRIAGIIALLIGPALDARGLDVSRPWDIDASPRVASRAASGPDLSVGLKSTKPAWPRNDAKLTVTIRNVGDIPAPKSDCRVIIRQGHAPRQVIRTIKKSVRALGAGEQYAFTFPVKVGLGLFEVAATVDRKNRIAETDETNNAAKIMIIGE